MKYKIIDLSPITIIGMECKARQWDADGEIGRVWSRFLESVDKVNKPIVPNVMYGICVCEEESGDTFTYMAGIQAEEDCGIPENMIKRTIRQQKFLRADVPEDIKTPDAYLKAIEYAKDMGYVLDEYFDLEVYEEIFKDPDDHAFTLLIPIK